MPETLPLWDDLGAFLGAHGLVGMPAHTGPGV